MGSFFVYQIIWIFYSFILVLPWLIVKYNKNNDFLIKFNIFLIGFPLFIIFIPSFYLLGLASPLEAAGVLFPRLKLLGFILFYLLIIIIINLLNILTAYSHPKLQLSCENIVTIKTFMPNFILFALICIVAIYSNEKYKKNEIPKKWIALSTKFETSSFNIYELNYLKSVINNLLDNGYKIIILPENTVGIWPKNKKYWTDIIIKANKKKSTILSGAYTNFDNGSLTKKYDSSIVSFGYKNHIVYFTRQPIPLAGWIPFSSHGLNAHWLSKGVGWIDHRKVEFLVCFEELLPGLISSSFLSNNPPQFIVSVVNNLVGKNTGERRSQYNSIYLMSRLFDAPLIRSWNR